MMVPMKTFSLLLFLMVPAIAQETWLHSQDVIYEGHSESTWYKLQDGREVQIVYDERTWPLLDAWPQGKRVQIAYNATQGPVLVDPDKGTVVNLLQIDGDHPIDTGRRQCLETAMTTQSMVECNDNAGLSWKREMERVYTAMLKDLKPQERAKVQSAQTQWLNFLNSEIEAIAALDTQGTMSRISRSGRVTALYRTRAQDLASLYGTYYPE